MSISRTICSEGKLGGRASGYAGRVSAASGAGEPARGPGPACGGPLAGDLGWALGTLFRAYARAAGEAVAGLDLPGGPRGYQVLAAARGEPPTQVMLAAHLGVDRTVMTYLLDDLEAAGLVERRPDPADRRVRRIVATQDGRALLARLDERLRPAEARVLATLEGADRDRFRDLLRRVATAAASDADPGEPPEGDADAPVAEAASPPPAARPRPRRGAR